MQQSPWLSVANRQMELMGRYMAEIGLTPASRSRIAAYAEAEVVDDKVDKIEFVIVYQDKDGNRIEKPVDNTRPGILKDPPAPETMGPKRIQVYGDL